MSKATVYERAMLDLVNGERAAAGLKPLRLELRLNDSAEDHSAWMIEADVFSHTGRNGSDAGQRMREAGFPFEGDWTWGENVALQSERGAEGVADDVADLHRGLMASEGHRANILNPDFEVMGIGVERGAYEGFDTVVVTQNFARSATPLRLDGGGATAKPAPQLESSPPAGEPNAAPVARVDDLALKLGQWRGIEELVRHSDADGDAAALFEIRVMGGGAQMRIGDAVVPARGGHVIAAADLDEVELRGGAAGTASTLRIRASDGEDWGRWDSFRLTTKAEATKPVVAVDDIAVAPSRYARLSSVVEVTGADGAEAWIEIFDGQGDRNFILRGDGRLDASRGARIPLERLDDILVQGDSAPSTQSLRARVWNDGEASEWERFVLTTTDGWDDIA